MSASNKISDFRESLLNGSDMEKQLQDPSLTVQRARSVLIHLRHVLVGIVVALLPSYVGRRAKNEPPKPFKVFPTSYLDGLRGIFSFLVFMRHYLLPWEKTLGYGYAQSSGGDDENRSLFKLPILRILYSGPTVAIFFVVSGYVVSYKPLKLIRKGQHEALIHALISSVFRRGMRLFLPPVVTTFIVAIAVYMQLYNAPYDLMPGTIPRHPENYRSLFLQLQDWARFLIVDMTHPWSWKSPKSEYDSHLWTIPIQFRSSMILFLAIIGLAKTRTRIRVALLFLLHVYCMMQKDGKSPCSLPACS
jgi:peptidoglycan/LPS O-acetylase OafA/YrhL